jgi:hypothetical protein
LGGIALVLLAVIVSRHSSMFNLPFSNGFDLHDGDPTAEIIRLKGVVAGADSINSMYRKLAWRYAEVMAPLETMREGETDGAAFVEQAIRRRLATAGTLAELAVSPATVDSGEAQTQLLPVDVSFTAADDGQAIAAIALLGLPEHGFAWDALALDADKQTKTIKVTGRVLVLTVKPAE